MRAMLFFNRITSSRGYSEKVVEGRDEIEIGGSGGDGKE